MPSFPVVSVDKTTFDRDYWTNLNDFRWVFC